MSQKNSNENKLIKLEVKLMSGEVLEFKPNKWGDKLDYMSNHGMLVIYDIVEDLVLAFGDDDHVPSTEQEAESFAKEGRKPRIFRHNPANDKVLTTSKFQMPQDRISFPLSAVLWVKPTYEPITTMKMKVLYTPPEKKIIMP